MKPALERADIERFRSLVVQRLGLHFDDAKSDFLADVVRQRMSATRSECFLSYEQRLGSSVAEMRILAEQLTVCETYMFRYAEHFRALAEVAIPERICVQASRRQLRLLSAGCASGEEAYSLAMVLRHCLPDFDSWNISILGIDVNRSMLEKAKCGRYSEWALRETSDEIRTRYFRPAGRDWLLDDAVKSMVAFEECNLIEGTTPFWNEEAFDIVFCRNVTMYFTPETMRSVISRISHSLLPGGFLFLGHAETLRGISQDFHLKHTHDTFYYQRREDLDAAREIYSQRIAVNGPPHIGVPALPESGNTWFDAIQSSSERIRSLTSDSAPNTVEGKAPGIAMVRTSGPDWERARAIELLRKEKFKEAIEILRALPAESRTDPDAQLLLAVLLTNQGELAEAEKVCQHLLTMDELNAGAHYLLALCREHAGDKTSAIQHDEAAVYLDSAFAMPHLHIGLIAKRSADLETARHQLSQASSLLAREDASRILLFGGGFDREALTEFCRTQLCACGGNA